MLNIDRRKLAWLLAALLAITGAAGVGVAIDEDGDGKPDRFVTRTIHVDGPDADTRRDDAVPLNPTAQETLKRTADADHGELNDPLREPADRGPVGVLEGPLAAQEWPGCRTRFVRNYSSRKGARPKIIVWHQTVSRERGWSSQDGLTALANSPSSGVSWHFLIGRSVGRCTFSVPLNMKAWTQGNANPFSIGIEVEAYGDEPSYVSSAGERKLLAVTRGLGRRYNIPMRRGLVRDCKVIRSGIVEHSELGACGGGHADVTWSTDQLIAKLQPRPITATDHATCRKLNAWRRAGRPIGGQWKRNSVRRRRALAARGVTCTPRGAHFTS